MTAHCPSRWRLQTSWLRDPKLIEFLGQQIDIFFENNEDETSASVRWEAFKAFLRGQMTSYTGSQYKAQRLELEQLEKQKHKKEEP